MNLSESFLTMPRIPFHFIAGQSNFTAASPIGITLGVQKLGKYNSSFTFYPFFLWKRLHFSPILHFSSFYALEVGVLCTLAMAFFHGLLISPAE